MKTMSAEQYRKLTQPKSKYRNKKTEVDGINFDSILEANRYCELKMLMASGKIQGFGRQPSFVLDISGRRYRPDFIVCGKDGRLWVEDAKGMETAEFKSKRRMWEKAYPWLPLEIIR